MKRYRTVCATHDETPELESPSTMLDRFAMADDEIYTLEAVTTLPAAFASSLQTVEIPLPPDMIGIVDPSRGLAAAVHTSLHFTGVVVKCWRPEQDGIPTWNSPPPIVSPTISGQLDLEEALHVEDDDAFEAMLMAEADSESRISDQVDIHRTQRIYHRQ